MKLLFSFLAASLLQVALAVKNCPLLGRDFPIPTKLNSSIIRNATASIKTSIDTFLLDGTLENYTSSFSVNIFTGSSTTTRSLFSYHHSSPFLNGTEGTSEVNQNTIYRIGSITKLFAVFLFLIEKGDGLWHQSVSKFVIELSGNFTGKDRVQDVDWGEVTLGNLASHMSGIGRDYLFDLQASDSNLLLDLGFPPNATALRTCVEQGNCSRTEFFDVFLKRHPVVPSSFTPIYNNVAFQLLAYALEDLTGRNFEEMLARDLLSKLGMVSTSYAMPVNSSRGAIPFNASFSSWNYSLGEISPAGNMYSSTRDLALLGRAILNSTLLTPAQTRRWMKPLTHTSDPMVSVGAPWEILRLASPSTGRITDLYTKDGEIGLYESQFALAPDWDVGFVVLQAGLSYNARVIANLISDVLFPALEEAARVEAQEVYAGTYTLKSGGNGTQVLNSSLTITTDAMKPGLGIERWVSNGSDVLAELTSTFRFNNTDVRLYPTGLKSGGRESWRAVFGTKQTLGAGIFSQTCTTWGLVDNYRYGGRAMDEFAFVVKDGKAESVDVRGLGVVLMNGG